jgi:hypothetical protein
MNFVNWRNRKEVLADLKPIYRAVNADEPYRNWIWLPLAPAT